MPGVAGPNAGVISGWTAIEDGWDADMNANLDLLDAWLHGSIKAVLQTPPVGPSEGDRYIIAAEATGAWADHDDELTVYRGGAWVFKAPGADWVLWVQSVGQQYRWDATAAAWRPVTTKVSADAFASLQAALEALDEVVGGVIEVKPGTLTVSATFTADRPLVLQGAGKACTEIYCADPDVDIIQIDHSNVTIRDLTIKGPGTAGTGIGIHIHNSSTSPIRQIRIHDVNVESTGAWCVKVCGPGSYDDDPSAGDIVGPYFQGCTFYNAKSEGLFYSGHGVAVPTLYFCNFVGRGYGTTWHWTAVPFTKLADGTLMPRAAVYLFCSNSALFHGCWFQTTGEDTPMLALEDCIMPRVLGCYFEPGDNATERAEWMIVTSMNRRLAIRDAYVYCPGTSGTPHVGPVRFLHTNQTGGASDSMTIDNVHVIQGSAEASDYVDDLVLCSDCGSYEDGAVVISNFDILANGTLRDVHVSHVGGGGGAGTFGDKNVLLQNAARRFRLPMVEAADLDHANIKTGDMVYVTDRPFGADPGGQIFIARSNHSFYPLPSIPKVGTTQRTGYTASEGDLVYDTDLHKLYVWSGSAWEACN